MNWSFQPPWSLRLIAAAGALLLVLALVRWQRERHGRGVAWLRAALVVALALVALNPEVSLPRPHVGKPRLVVLLDTSASMATRDAGGEPRLGWALRRLQEPAVRAALEREFNLEVRRFDRTAGPAALAELRAEAAQGDASDLAGALRAAASDQGESSAQAGVLVVSDGRATTGGLPEAAQLALARSVPLWTCCVGGQVPRQDLWLETAASEALAFSGAEVELAATLHAAGYPNRSFEVRLEEDDRTLDRAQAVPDTNGVARVVFRVKAPAAGERRYVFRVPAEPEEADGANNERVVFLRAVGGQLRVLVAEGQPHWDTKFLVQSLKRDTNVDLTAVYRLNANRHVAVVSATGAESRVERDLFPRTAEAMNRFDVVVLGRSAETFFDERTETLLSEFVSRRGGSLVFARGKSYGGRYPALAKLEPVAWGSGAASSVRLRPTEAGRDSPVFDLGAAGGLEELLERLPALERASLTLGEKPLAVVLAASPEPDGPVLLACQRYGQGRTVSVNATGLWRWAFRETGQEESEVAYRRFWISLLQWLLAGGQFLPGADVSLTSARRYYHSEQPMEFLIATRNLDPALYEPRLTIEGGGQRVEVTPRRRGDAFVAQAGPFAPGTYRVQLKSNLGQPAELTQSVEVVSASLEKRDLSADPAAMRQLAAVSGGAVVNGAELGRLPDAVRRWEAARQLAERQAPIWDRAWVLAGLLGLLGGEWWWRRREGHL